MNNRAARERLSYKSAFQLSVPKLFRTATAVSTGFSPCLYVNVRSRTVIHRHIWLDAPAYIRGAWGVKNSVADLRVQRLQDVAAQTRLHCWRHAQGLMDPTEVVIRKPKCHGCRVILNSLRKR